MFKTLAFLSLHLFVATAAHAAQPACERQPAEQVELADRFSYEVAGSGRLHFHTGPDEKCIQKKVFVVPGDSLAAYSEYGKRGEWSFVMYVAKNGNDYSGWVRTERLRFMGAFGGNLTPDKVKYYERAAEAAKAGKLGSP